MSFRFALLYAVISMLCSAVLLIWPNCIEGLAQTSPRLGCLASSLWRRRFHDGTEVLLWTVLALACLAVIEILPGLAPALEPLAQDGAGAASGEGDRGSGWLSEKFFPETLGCLETSGARYVVGVYVGRWLPFLPIQARMEGPPEHCLEACEEYLQLESWTIAGVATEPTLEAAPPHRSRRGAGSDSSSISSSASRFAVPSATSPSSLPTQWGTSVAPSKHTATPPKATTRATTIAAASTSGSDNNPRTSPTSTASSSAASSSPTSPPPFPASRSNSSPSLSPSSSSSSSASPTRSGPATAELDMVILGDIEYGGGGGGGGDEKNGERNSEPMPEKKVIVVTEVLNLPRVVGAALALGGGLRLVILIVRIVEGYILGPHFSEIARLKFGRFVTRVIAPGQLGLAVLRTLYFLGSLQRGQLTPVSACFVVFFNFLLELAWLPLAVLPLYYAHMVAVTVRDSYNFCLGAASTVTALLHEVAELVMKEIYPNVDHELSLPWSTSSTSDDSCAVCLGPLYPDLSEAYQGEPRCFPSSALGRLLGRLFIRECLATLMIPNQLAPRFRASMSRRAWSTTLVRVTVCRHAFHRECFEDVCNEATWNGLCPTCRSPCIVAIWRSCVPAWLRRLHELLWSAPCRALFSRGLLLVLLYLWWHLVAYLFSWSRIQVSGFSSAAAAATASAAASAGEAPT